MKSYCIAVDIGGTKCAVSRWECGGELPIMSEKIRFATLPTPKQTIQQLCQIVRKLAASYQITAAGISCGGPLDSKRGLLMEPPNLPGWIDVDIVSPISQAAGAPAYLQNDANACALAEWLWGAGKGLENIIFLTFGTGMGGGLILDGRLYCGTSDMGGEVGHLRLAEDGPVGFGKAGSFEGFCSGGGMARLAVMRLPQWNGKPSVLADEPEKITAKTISDAADAGDEFALSIINECGQRLGQGLALLVDILNPQRIIIGSIYGREPRFAPIVKQVLSREAIPYALAVCDVTTAGLGESVGDYAAVAAAIYAGGIK